MIKIESIKHSLQRLRCWWFGCEPDMEAIKDAYDYECVPCSHCGAPDVSYADQVGDTRHHRFLERLDWLRWHLFSRWIPGRCPECGLLDCRRDDCDGIPF